MIVDLCKYMSLICDKQVTNNAQKMKFPINEFFSKWDRIRSFLRIWSHLLKKSLIENLRNVKSSTRHVWTNNIEPVIKVFLIKSDKKLT